MRIALTRIFLTLLLMAVIGCQPVGVSRLKSEQDVNLPGATVIANNTASLHGTVTGPAGLLFNSAAQYRTQVMSLVPVTRALVYLTNLREQFYAGADGKALGSQTDEQGSYSFPSAPAGVPVIVTVLLEKNRRMVGFINPLRGTNQLDIDLATTVVTEFLRDQARLSHRNLADFPALSTELPGIIAMTRQLIDDGLMHFRLKDSDPGDYLDLSVNGIPAMCHDYVRAFAATNKPLSDAWARLLGYRSLLIEDLDVGQAADMQLIAVAASSRSIYTAAVNAASLVITETASGSAPRVLVNAPRSSGIDYIAGMTASGSMLFLGASGVGQLQIDTTKPLSSLLIDLGTLETGANFVQINAGLDPAGSSTAFDVELHGDWVYVTSDMTNEIYRYHLDAAGNATGSEQIVGIPLASPSKDVFNGDSPADGNLVRINRPSGVTYHEENGKPYLYFADTLNHRIRRTLLSTTAFSTETVLGIGTTLYGNMLMPPGSLEDGKLPASKVTDIDDPRGVPKDSATLDFPHKVLFDGESHMFIADTDHRRIRMFDGKRVYTLAGTVPGAPLTVGDSRRSGLGEVSSIVFDGQGNLLIADVRSNRLRRLRLPFGL